ncbi:HHIP-like protein 2 [Tachypleus tridentatus]|uniref:HHIP-like protein 2 n=1 Tax=Tachypleus tridentatus TaxID=6853 RepID=UPI003FD42D8A
MVELKRTSWSRKHLSDPYNMKPPRVSPSVRLLACVFLSGINVQVNCVLQECFCLQEIASNLRHPTTVVSLPDPNSQRILIVEHLGTIKLIDLDCPDKQEIILDLTDRVLTTNKLAEERGLLSVTLNPGFNNTGYLFVCYSNRSTISGIDHKMIVSRFPAQLNNVFKVDKTSEEVVLEIEQPGPRQNGGQVFSEKMDTSSYQNRIICGDVGEDDRNEEEINIIVPGGRYGWIDIEHAPCRSLKECKKVENLLQEEDQLPIHIYSLPKGQAVVGGVVYRGTNIRSLQGLYVYGDFVHGSLHYLKEENKEWTAGNLCVREKNNKHCNKSFSQKFILGLEADRNGEILVLTTSDLRNNVSSGKIYRLQANPMRVDDDWNQGDSVSSSPLFVCCVLVCCVLSKLWIKELSL